MQAITDTEWEVFLAGHPDAHLLQTSAWGELKSAFGWDVIRVLDSVGMVGAQIIFRRLPLGFSLAYIPRGPVGGGGWVDWKPLWAGIDKICRQRRAVFLKVEPDLWISSSSSYENAGRQMDNTPEGFRFSPQDIQPPRTLVVDLQGDEDHILGRMKQKTRYNIRLALKKGVVVRVSTDLDAFYQMLTVTGSRDSFSVHSLEYYRKVSELFSPQGACQLFVAEYQGEPLAAVMVFAHGKRAWYFYGASSSVHRERMPTYLVQWEAMRWARSQGCLTYDLWGVPDYDLDTLEAEFTKHRDGLWGVYRFKRGFGGQLMRSSGPWDRVYQPVLYAFYRWWIERRKYRAG